LRAAPALRKPARAPSSGLRQPAENAAGVAEYIADIAAELARLAGSARLDTLTYLLNMARMEAQSHISQTL